MTAIPQLAFTADAGDVVLDVDALLEFGLFVEGISRSGKSTLVRLMLEQTFGAVQHLIFDPEGEYLNLRSARRPYLLIGPGRDVALPAGDAAVRTIVTRLVELGQSAIIDLSEIDDEQQQVIVTAVCDALARRSIDARGDVLVVLPELQDFAAEGGSRDSALAAVRRLAKRGAKRGARLIADSQRVADVSKGVIAMLKNKAIGLTDRADVKRAGEELGLPVSERGQLTTLAQGTFYVKSPAAGHHAVLVRVPKPETMPAKRRRGERPAPPAEAPAEIAKLAASLLQATAAAAQETADVEQLREQVRTLREQLAERPAGAPDPEAVARAVKAAVADVEHRWQHRAREASARLQDVPADLRAAADAIDAAVGYLAEPAAETVPVPVERPAAPVASSEGSARATMLVSRLEAGAAEVTRARSLTLTPLQQRILDALAECDVLGIAPVSRAQAAFLANYASLTGGTGGKAVGALVEMGLLALPGPGLLTLTRAGEERARYPEAPPSRRALHTRALSRMDGVARRVLEHLLTIYPASASRPDIATAIGYASLSGGTGGKAVGDLVELRFAEIPSAGMLRAGRILFPDGLR